MLLQTHKPTIDRVRLMATRKGMTLIELLVASALATTIISATLQYVGALKNRRQTSEHRDIAIQHARNLAEMLSEFNYDLLDKTQIDKLIAERFAETRLPDGRIQVELSAVPDEQARQIRIEVHWRDRAGHAAAPVRLNMWRYHIGS